MELLNRTAEENEKFEFMGIEFANVDLDEAVERIESFIADRRPRMIFTPNAECIVRAHEDARFKAIYNAADMLSVDSFVTYYAARLCGKPVKEPVSAARLMFRFLERCAAKGYRIYLLGASREVVSRVKANLEARYPSIQIAGLRDGYFGSDDAPVVREIAEARPDILFVAMSSPMKELFVSAHAEEMNVPVSLGVGGSFDILAGKCKHAPAWVSRLGCEWLYRLAQEPRRLFKRYLITNTKFLALLIRYIATRRNESRVPAEHAAIE